MLAWRVFERTLDGAREYWKIRQEGIRCFIGWGPVGDIGGRGAVSTLNDEKHAQRHLERKIRAQLRLGYIEMAGEPVPTGDPAALVVDTLADALDKPAYGLKRPEYRPVEGFPGVVCHAEIFPRSPNRGFYRYLILRDEGRRAVAFNVQEASHDPEAVAAFLETAVTVSDLPFNGRSHQKLPLIRPARRFDHILLCSPALGGAAKVYPDIARRVASAFPIYDCEIGDADTARRILLSICASTSSPREESTTAASRCSNLSICIISWADSPRRPRIVGWRSAPSARTSDG